MKNNIFKICFIMFALMMQACSEYEVVNIPPNTGVAPDEPDDRVLFPNPEKNIDLPDGPVDLGDPLINSVVFDPSYVPPAGSIIDISYNILGGC